MSNESDGDKGFVVLGEPVLPVVQNAGKFEISVDTQRFFYNILCAGLN